MKKQIRYRCLILLIIFLLAFSFSSCLSKKKQIKSALKTNTEQIQYMVKEKFNHNYLKQKYPKNRMVIGIDSTDGYSYFHVIDDVVLYALKSDSAAVAILKNGLVSLDMLEVDIKPSNHYFVKSEEILFLKSTKKKKRFFIYKWADNQLYSTMFVIELTNINAKQKTKVTDFVNGAEVSFFYVFSIRI